MVPRDPVAALSKKPEPQNKWHQGRSAVQAKGLEAPQCVCVERLKKLESDAHGDSSTKTQHQAALSFSNQATSSFYPFHSPGASILLGGVTSNQGELPPTQFASLPANHLQIHPKVCF